MPSMLVIDARRWPIRAIATTLNLVRGVDVKQLANVPIADPSLS